MNTKVKTQLKEKSKSPKSPRTPKAIYKSPSLKKDGKRKPGELAEKKIKFYQNDKNVNLRHIPRLAVYRLIKEVSQEFATDLKISKNVVEVLHEVLENYIVNLYSSANTLATADGRETVMVKDFEVLDKLSKLGVCNYSKIK